MNIRRHNLSVILIIAFIIIWNASLHAQFLRTYQGTLPAPTAEQWQSMLQHRLEKHPCQQKHAKQAERLKLGFLRGQTEPTTNQYRVDMLYYKINLELDFSSMTIDGYVEAKIRSLVDGLNQVDFNLTTTYGSLNVSTIKLNGQNLTSWSHLNDLLTVNLGQSLSSGTEFTIRIDYGGWPGFDGNDGLEFYSYGSTEVAYTNCEPWGAQLWWPCKDFPYDKPDSLDMIIRHPTGYKLVSNGLLRSSTNNGDGTTTTHWHEKYPIATYLVQLGCANYTKYTDSWQYQPGQYMPLEQYSYPGISQYSHYYSLYYMLNYTKPSLEALSYYYTLYPFIDEKYGHNHYGWSGAMEHQTLTSISPDFNSEYVIPHELSHQWAGDKITCVNFHHMWLNEGFASYSEALYFKYQYGDYYYKDWLESQKHLDAGTPYVEDLINDNIFDPITVYDKGGWVVYMLHMILGDSLFLETMDQYFNDPVLAFGAASTDDLKGICEVAYGQDLDWFFNTWIYQPGNPNYVYSLRSDPDPVNGGYDVFLLIRQVQSWALFPMPIDVKIFTAGPDTAFTVFNNQRGQLWKVDLPYPADSAWLDPDEKILRTVEYDPEFTLSIMVEKLTDTAYIGQPYYAEYYTIGAEGDCNWRKISGQIPYGLALHNFDTAYIDGTPTWAADYVFSLEATDSDVPPNADTITLKIVVLQSEAPAIPQLIAPVNLSTISDNTPQFMWSSTAGAGGNYTLQYARNISFTQELTTQAGIADTFYTPAAALGEGLWYWHAEAVNSGGSHSGYQASPFRFTINSQGQIRGDCNHDDYVDVSDAVYIINYVFVGGPPPVPYEIGDANCDEYVDVGDAVYIINYVFVGGPPPCSL